MNIDEKNMRSDPFFVVYKPRSGSTYLTNLLVKNPLIGITPESKFVFLLWQWSKNGKRKVVTKEQLIEIIDIIYSEPKFAAWQLPKEQIFENLSSDLPLNIGEIARRIIFIQCQRAYPNCLVWGLKKGGWYVRNVPVLRSLFPQAKFIHIIRDGRAVFASAKKAIHGETRLPFERNPIQSAITWKTFVSEFDKWENTNFALEVQYEELITHPAGVLEKILMFLGVGAEKSVTEKMLEPHQSYHVHERYSHLHPHVGKPPQNTRINAWREELSQHEVRIFERIAGRALEKKGYTLTFPRSRGDDLYAIALEGMWLGTRLLHYVGIDRRPL